jgi:hypothetical protein
VAERGATKGLIRPLNVEPLPGGGLRLELEDREAWVITQALNEVCNGISIPEFSTRMGASREAVVEMLDRLYRALSQR